MPRAGLYSRFDQHLASAPASRAATPYWFQHIDDAYAPISLPPRRAGPQHHERETRERARLVHISLPPRRAGPQHPCQALGSMAGQTPISLPPRRAGPQHLGDSRSRREIRRSSRFRPGEPGRNTSPWLMEHMGDLVDISLPPRRAGPQHLEAIAGRGTGREHLASAPASRAATPVTMARATSSWIAISLPPRRAGPQHPLGVLRVPVVDVLISLPPRRAGPQHLRPWRAIGRASPHLASAPASRAATPSEDRAAPLVIGAAISLPPRRAGPQHQLRRGWRPDNGGISLPPRRAGPQHQVYFFFTFELMNYLASAPASRAATLVVGCCKRRGLRDISLPPRRAGPQHAHNPILLSTLSFL